MGACGLPPVALPAQEVDVAINQAQQMIFRNLIFEAEVVKQRFPRVGGVPS
jgi:hypothetical protein